MGTDFDNTGLENRYSVERLTESRSGKTHDENCEYFVLDLTHDPKARMAAIAYANSVSSSNPKLAMDLRQKVERCRAATPSGVDPW